jgi:hypothetical protein
MELRVVRHYYAPDCTIGRMLVDGQFECYTLEDGIRTNKVAGETAIPEGRYPVKITYSNAFRRELPLVEGVRNFTGIRIHSGNSKKDTLGCILVGQSWTPGADVIGASVRAMQALLPKIRAALGAGEAVTLSVEQPDAPPELASRELQPVVPRSRKRALKNAGRTKRRLGPTIKTGRARTPAKNAKPVAKKGGASARLSKPVVRGQVKARTKAEPAKPKPQKKGTRTSSTTRTRRP